MTTHKCLNPQCDTEVDKKGKYCPPCKKERKREQMIASNARVAAKKLKEREVNPLPCKECGGARENAYDPLCKVCREKIREMRARSRARVKARLDAEEAELKAAPKPSPRPEMSYEERQRLDKAQRLAEVAAEKELAERRKNLDPRMLFERRFAGVIPIYAEGYASPKVEYQPPQRARIFASDAASTWEG